MVKQYLHPGIFGSAEDPVIQSLLDSDFYKFTMWQLLHEFPRFGGAQVTYRFANRTKKVRLAEIVPIERLREELDHTRTLRFTKDELLYLQRREANGKPMFSDSFISSRLEPFQLPEYHLEKGNDGQFLLEFPATWDTGINWETIALETMQELYTRQRMAGLSRFEQDTIYATGIVRLAEKIRTLKQFVEILIIEFGSRRRAARVWQAFVTAMMASELGAQLRGTSNTRLAMDLDLLPMGTNAHELQMVMAAIMSRLDDDRQLVESSRTLLGIWQVLYGDALSIALPDTFGSKGFFEKVFTPDYAAAWKGTRHDSGDPIAYGEYVINFYNRLGIDPTTKTIIFSDGLDLPTILKINEHFRDRINYSFGWGTNLTNDLGLDTLSIVIKAAEVNGISTVKLSDNPAKAMGKPEDIARYKRAFGYDDSNPYRECIV